MFPDERAAILRRADRRRKRGNSEEKGGQRHPSHQHLARETASHRLLTPFVRTLLYSIIAQAHLAVPPNNWESRPRHIRRGKLSKNGLRKVDCDRLKAV